MMNLVHFSSVTELWPFTLVHTLFLWKCIVVQNRACLTPSLFLYLFVTVLLRRRLLILLFAMLLFGEKNPNKINSHMEKHNDLLHNWAWKIYFDSSALAQKSATVVQSGSFPQNPSPLKSKWRNVIILQSRVIILLQFILKSKTKPNKPTPPTKPPFCCYL